MKKILTVWAKRTYDVWGNAKEGFDVNDSFSCGEISLRIPVEKNNVGTPQEFESAYPTDRQLRRVFGMVGHWRKINTEGDDLHIYVNRDDGYPLGELICVSHESLLPIRKAKAKE